MIPFSVLLYLSSVLHAVATLLLWSNCSLHVLHVFVETWVKASERKPSGHTTVGVLPVVAVKACKGGFNGCTLVGQPTIFFS